MKTIRNILFCVLCLVLASSCEKDFDKLAVNPNNPEEVGPDLLMVNIIRATVNNMVNDAFSTGNVVIQQLAVIRDPGTDRYIWNSFGTWDNGYSTLRDVNSLFTIADERGLNNYKGIALIWKTLIFSRLTDAYGDLPFSEALGGKSDGIYFPAYDPQQNIYEGMMADLEQANNLLDPNGEAVSNDILYQGDILKWKKLGNSLHMRLLVRQSKRVDPSAALQAMVNDPERYPIFGNNADQAVLRYTTSPNYYPIAGQRSGDFVGRRLSKTFADVLNNIHDPRLPVWFRPTDASVDAADAGNGALEWKGVRNGETDQNLGSDINRIVSRVGSMFYIDQQVPAPAEGLVMTYAEVEFILAEAAEMGWIDADAEEHYLKGIRASIAYYQGFSDTPLLEGESDYFTQEGVVYDKSKGLEMIGVQKWMALFFNDLQGWYEWKRTGFPHLDPSIVNNNNNIIPVRFRYPTDQQVTNQENYNAAVARQGRDDINTHVWWDVD